jgi:hypothetical protein
MWWYKYHTWSFLVCVCATPDPGGFGEEQLAYPITQNQAQQLSCTWYKRGLIDWWIDRGWIPPVQGWFSKEAWKEAGWVL